MRAVYSKVAERFETPDNPGKKVWEVGDEVLVNDKFKEDSVVLYSSNWYEIPRSCITGEITRVVAET